MQNKYVGDVGDFAKYALLRRLAGTEGEHQVRLGVVWCLHPDEGHTGDGRHVTYLRHPDFEGLDDDLLAKLRSIVNSGRRSISAITEEGIFPQETIFCDSSACLPKGILSNRADRLIHRSKWLEHCLRVTTTSELIFFDPDNGLEIASVPKHDIKAGKYIYWDELAAFWIRDQALLIYHHLNRTKSVFDQVTQLSKHFQIRFPGGLIKPLIFRRGSCRVFWLVCPRTSFGCEIQGRARSFLTKGWIVHYRQFDRFSALNFRRKSHDG